MATKQYFSHSWLVKALRGFVWVVALANCVATVYTNAPKQPREAIFADLCTLLHTHGCPQRCNSVHKCPETAPRGRFCRSVYTPASPPTGRPVGEGSTACSRAKRAAGWETPGQAARPRRCGGCRTTCSPRRGDRPGLGQLEHATCGVALRDVPAKEGRAAGLPPQGPSHTQARFAPADGARSSRACY